jgi:hypothetical protein
MNASNGINQQLQPIDRAPDAEQRRGDLIGKQSERGSARGQTRQRTHG